MLLRLVNVVTALLLAAASVSSVDAALSRVSIDQSTVTTLLDNDSSSNEQLTAQATVLIEDNDLYSMPEFLFTGMEGESIVFVLIEATTDTFGRVTWRGTDGSGAFCTLMQNSNDSDVFGNLHTTTSAFTLTKSASAYTVNEVFWRDAKVDLADAAAEDDQATPNSGGGGEGYGVANVVSNNDNGSPVAKIAEIVKRKNGATVTKSSTGAAASFLSKAPPAGKRKLLRQQLDSQDKDQDNDTPRTLAAAIIEIDVLVIVTNRALCESVGAAVGCTGVDTTNFDQQIDLQETQTNAAMSAVGVGAKINVVQTIYLEPGYDGFPNAATLADMKNRADFVAYRNSAGADLVQMITGPDPEQKAGGLAYINDFRSITSWRNLPYYTFTHEIGHSMGAHHNREEYPNQPHKITEYAHGYRDPNRVLRTVMAYNCPNGGCVMIPQFSANGYSWQGTAIGDDAHDNARVLNDNAVTVAGWMTKGGTSPNLPAPTSPAPAPAPVYVAPTQPTSSSGGGGGGGGGGCFSKVATVHVEGRPRPVPMKELRIGDRVLTGKNGVYAPVYAFGHLHATQSLRYLQIVTTNDNTSANVLEISKEHMVFVEGKTGPVRADSVKVGDVLFRVDPDQKQSTPAVITRIASIERQGLYAPLTPGGTIVVDGILASTYVAVQSRGNEYIEIQGGTRTTPLIQADLVHLWLSPLRLVCRGVSPKFCESSHNKDGFHTYVAFGMKTMLWGERRNVIVQVCMLALVLVVMCACHTIEFLMASSYHSLLLPAAVIIALWKAFKGIQQKIR